MLIENRVRQPQHENPKNDHGMWDEDLGARRAVPFIAPFLIILIIIIIIILIMLMCLS